MYDLVGFHYDNSGERIEAHGYNIPKSLLDKGYVQKNDSDGVPRWYVCPCKVYIILDVKGQNRKYDVYKNIMALYPDRTRISLKLAHEVIKRIINGDIIVEFKEGKPFFYEKHPRNNSGKRIRK